MENLGTGEILVIGLLVFIGYIVIKTLRKL